MFEQIIARYQRATVPIVATLLFTRLQKTQKMAVPRLAVPCLRMARTVWGPMRLEQPGDGQM
jgi:hypothetical protein